MKNVSGAASNLASTIYVELQMKESLNVIAKFRTISQPKNPTPVFREEFEFHNIEFNDRTYVQLDIIVKNSILSLGESETKVGTITLKLSSLLKPPYISNSGRFSGGASFKDWFTLHNHKTGAPIAAGDAALHLDIHLH